MPNPCSIAPDELKSCANRRSSRLGLQLDGRLAGLLTSPPGAL